MMSQPEITIIRNYTTGKYYVRCKSEYLGPYTDKSDCDRAKDMLTIKFAFDRNVPLEDIETVYPVDSYYKTKEAYESVKTVSLKQFIKQIQTGGPSQSNGNGKQAPPAQAPTPNRPRPAPCTRSLIDLVTPAKTMPASAHGGRKDLRRKAPTPPVACCRKRPVSGPTYHRSESECEDEDEDDNREDDIRRPLSARKNAFPGPPPILSPRQDPPFLGVILDWHDNYAEIEIPSNYLSPPSPDSSENTHTYNYDKDHTKETAPRTPEKCITVRSMSCKTEQEAALAYDLLMIWRSKGEVAPDPNSLNFPLPELWKHPLLLGGARKCVTHVEIGGFVDGLIESGKLRKLVLSAPADRAGAGADAGAGGLDTPAADNKPRKRITRNLEKKSYVELTMEEEEEETSDEEEEWTCVSEKGARKRGREESNVGQKGSYWTEEELNVLETSLKKELGEKWWDEIGTGAGLGDLYRCVYTILKGLGYNRRSYKAVENKAMRLKIQRQKEAMQSAVRHPKMRQQTSRAAAAAAAADDDGAMSSPASVPASVPASAPASAPAPSPAATVVLQPQSVTGAPAATGPPPTSATAMLDEIETLLENTPGLSLSDEAICKYLAECVRDAETRAWNHRTLSKYAAQGKPNLIKTHVEGVIK